MPTLLQQNLETWLARRRAGRLAAGADWVVDPVPAFVERDLRKFLECGILAHGFARARCDKCGQDFLVAYSCKGRGVCPGCNTRRMVETAAHMVEHVFPAVAVRQWVVVFPKRLRYFLDRDAGCLNRVAMIAKSEVQRATAGVRTSTAKAVRIGGCYLFTALVYHECACVFAPLHAGVRVAAQDRAGRCSCAYPD